MVNTMSAVCSGLTIMFLFWTITLFGRKLFNASCSDKTYKKEDGTKKTYITDYEFMYSIAIKQVCSLCWALF